MKANTRKSDVLNWVLTWTINWCFSFQDIGVIVSKGSKRRPTFIKDEEYRINYEKIYDRGRGERGSGTVRNPETLDRTAGDAGERGLKTKVETS